MLPESFLCISFPYSGLFFNFTLTSAEFARYFRKTFHLDQVLLQALSDSFVSFRSFYDRFNFVCISSIDIEYNKRIDRQRPCFEDELTE